MAESGSATNKNGAFPAITIILCLFAIVGGFAAVVRPIQGRMDSMEKATARMEKRIEEQIQMIRSAMAADDQREIFDQRERATLREKFTEVETQFDSQDDRLRKIEDWLVWWRRTIPKYPDVE